VPLGELAPALPLLLVAWLYLRAYRLVRSRRVGWPLRRVALFLTGLGAVAAALLPPLATHDEAFPMHVLQHLLLGMAAPLALALSAPVTLALRVLPPRARRPLVELLHAGPVRVVAHPLAAATLAVVPLGCLYLTPLYGATREDPVLHDAVHLHFLLVGCLFAWAVVGADPMPGRAGIRVRGAAIVLVSAAHGTIAKLAYAAGPAAAAADGVSVADWRLGTELMWYGGDAVELLLASAFALQWYRREGQRLLRAAPTPAGARQPSA
jgi:putative membrane protein